MSSEPASAGTSLRVAMLACPYGDGPESIAPLGAMSVLSHAQAALGRRIETMVFDFSGAAPGDLSALQPLVAWRPDVIGVPVYTNQVAIVDSWVAAVRRNLPGAVLVAGGPHPTLTASTYLARRPGRFDVLIRGDGEGPMTELLRRRLAGHPGLDVPGATLLEPWGAVRHLPDSAPTVAADMTNPFAVPIRHCNEELVFTEPGTGLRRRAIALVSSRSCPLRCSFCAIIAMPGKWRAVPTERLMDWLCEARQRAPFEHVYFMDANFFVVPARVREIASCVERRLPGVTWSASSTVGMLLKVAADLPALRRSGLRMVEMGIEAGSQRQLRFLNKQATVAQNLAAVRALQRHGIAIGVDFIMFYPDQTLEELRENLSFLREADLTLQEDPGHLFNSLALYPGTPIRDLYESRHGPFDPDVLPDIGPMFVHEEVRAIHRLFRGEFRRRYLPIVRGAVALLRRAGRELAGRHPAEAQLFRLLAIRAHHLPYRVLWELAHVSARETLEDTLPWLREWPRRMEALARRIGELAPRPQEADEHALCHAARRWSGAAASVSGGETAGGDRPGAFPARAESTAWASSQTLS